MGNFGQRITEFQTDHLFKSLSREGGGVKEASEAFLRMANVRGKYLHEADPKFEDDRKRLNTEAGIMISNHPHYVDVALVLQTLDRNDVMIMANPGPIKYMEKHKIKGNFVSASGDSKENIGIFKKIIKHIKAGGLFVIFPTGGDERDTGSIDFKQGLPHILKYLKPTNMVYSFYVEPGDIGEVEKMSGGRPLGVMSEITVNENVNINRFREKKEVRVNEAYSQAGEWQEVMRSGHPFPRAKELTEHYLKKFNVKIGGE